MVGKTFDAQIGDDQSLDYDELLDESLHARIAHLQEVMPDTPEAQNILQGMLQDIDRRVPEIRGLRAELMGTLIAALKDPERFFAWDVRVDCRSWVGDYVAGNGTKVGVQFLVRGHHKRQVCGRGRVDRKWIHIEPYWKGDRDAPIAQRTHRIGGREESCESSTSSNEDSENS